MDEINSPILSIPGINYRMGAMIIAEIGDFNRFDSPDKSWLMPDYLLLHTSQDNLMAHTPTWKSVVPDIYDMPYTTQPNMSVTGIQHSLNIWQRNEPKANITMLPYLMPSKMLGFELFYPLSRKTQTQQYIKAA